MNRRQVNCKHYEEEARRTGVYTYQLIGMDINLCNACEKKLRKQIFEQDSIETEMEIRGLRNKPIPLRLLSVNKHTKKK